MDDNKANSNTSINPLSSSLREEGVSLSSDYKQTLIPHLPWIMAYNYLERSWLFSGVHSTVPLPIVADSKMTRRFLTGLQCIRFRAMMEVFDRGFPMESRTLLPKAHHIPFFPPPPNDISIQLHHTMILSVRRALRSLTQVILPSETSNTQSLVIGWGPIYQLLFVTPRLGRNAVRDEAVEDILLMLGDLSQHIPDLLHGSSPENRWGLQNLMWAYGELYNGWLHHGNPSIARALARILLTSDGVHRIPRLDPTPSHTYSDYEDQRVALGIACAAWCPPIDLAEHADGEKRRVKISRAAIKNTLVILENISDRTLNSGVCCIRSVLQHPRRGEEEFEFPSDDEDAWQLVDEVYRQFHCNLEVSGYWDYSGAHSIPTSEPVSADMVDNSAVLDVGSESNWSNERDPGSFSFLERGSGSSLGGGDEGDLERSDAVSPPPTNQSPEVGVRRDTSP